MTHLPRDAAVWVASAGIPSGWTPTDVLLMDLWQAVTGEPHPARPVLEKKDDEDTRSTTSLVERLRAQRERLSRREEGEASE